MSATPSGPWSVPTPPPAAQAPPGTKRVSSAGYWISAAILVFGVLGSVIWFVVSLVGVVSAVDDYERVMVPGTLTTQLDAGTFTLFDEYPGATSSLRAPPEVQVTGPLGEAVRVRTKSVTQTYNHGDHEGRSFGEFDADRAGTYTFVVRGEPRGSSLQRVAIGKGYSFASFGGVVGSMALGGVSLLVGLTILVVTIIRRSRNRRAKPPTPPYPSGGYGGYGSPGAAPPGGYPPQPYPPQPYPPQAYPPSPYPPSPAPPTPPTAYPPPSGPPSWPPPGPPTGPPPGPPVGPPPAPGPPGQRPPVPRSPWDPPGSGDPPPRP